MLSNILTTRLILASLPALIHAQSILTTLYFTNTQDGQVSSIEVPFSPQQAHTETTTITEAGTTITQTTALQPSVETTTIVLTGPYPQVSSVADGIPKSIQVEQPSVPAGPVVPVTVHGYSTTIQLPSSVSLPSTAITIAPPAIASSASSALVGAGSTASEKASQAAASVKSQASQAGSSISEKASQIGASISQTASEAGSSLSSAAAAASTHLPTVVPVPVPGSGASLQNSVSQAATTALTHASNDISSASTAVASAKPEASTAATSLNSAGSASLASDSSALAAQRSTLSAAIAGTTESTTTTVGTSILTDTSTTAPTTLETSTSTATPAASTTTQVSQVSQSTSTVQSSTSAAPSPSSTAAPNGSAVFRASFWHGFVGAVVVGVGLTIL